VARLTALYQPDDLIAIGLCSRYAARLASDTLLAETFGLPPNRGGS
jgi:hypothetical protein